MRTPRSAARSAAIAGSGDSLFSPSVNRTITADGYQPCGGDGGVSDAERLLDFRIGGSPASTAIAFNDTRIPFPSDVPRRGTRRSIVASVSSLLFVGACTEIPPSLKATTPIEILVGCLSTNWRAA